MGRNGIGIYSDKKLNKVSFCASLYAAPAQNDGLDTDGAKIMNLNINHKMYYDVLSLG